MAFPLLLVKSYIFHYFFRFLSFFEFFHHGNLWPWIGSTSLAEGSLNGKSGENGKNGKRPLKHKVLEVRVEKHKKT